MENYEAIVSTLAITMGASWASGINLYAVILVLGLGGATGNVELPPGLTTLEDPMILTAAGLMYGIEFFADKIPGVDTGWDTLHTFIRIPAGAVLAFQSVGDISPVMGVAAAMVGGSLSATSHATKAGSRMLINTSPEPFSNWTASIGEDIAVLGGLWAALNHPVLFLIFLLLFTLFAIWVLPKLWRLILTILRKIGNWLGFNDTTEAPITTTPHASTENEEYFSDKMARLEKIHTLFERGALTEAEYEQEKQKILNNDANMHT